MDEFDDEGSWRNEFDADQRSWSADLFFWRPAKLSDESMQLHFSMFDGRWSEPTKQAVSRFHAAGLDLNENWALSRQSWSCPVCKRSKSEIFRLTQRKILLAKLELHHDHLRDWIWPWATKLFGAAGFLATPGAGLILDQVRDLTSRFSYALVCSECNAADGLVKGKARGLIDERFSFTPAEIALFVSPHANGPHDVDVEKALDVWTEEKENFAYRTELADRLLHDVKAGRIARDRLGLGDSRVAMSALDEQAVLREAFDYEAANTQRGNLLLNYRSEFLARSTCRDSSRLPPLARAGARARVPTPEDFEAYVDKVSPRHWIVTPADWRCPVCDRDKRSILRLSNAGQWSGSIRTYYTYVEEVDEECITNRLRLFPSFENARFIGASSFSCICSDCSTIPAQLSQWDRSISDPYITLEDLQKCILEAAPHAKHKIDFEEARRRACANEPFKAAITAFNSYRARASDFGGRYRHWVKSGQTHDRMIGIFAEELHYSHQIEDLAECRRLAEWLVAQYRLFRRQEPEVAENPDAECLR